jgi:NTE family protein
MLLASAYLPVFKNEPLGGKRYADGGFADALPIRVLVKNGYTDIIAVRLYGYGVTRRVRIPAGTKVHMVAPLEDLGGILEFEPEQSRRNMVLGYYDTLRMLCGLKGTRWYFDARWDEKRAYEFTAGVTADYLRQEGRTVTLRQLNERVLPDLARSLGVRSGDYRDLAVALLETGGDRTGQDRWRVYTEDEMAAAAGEYPMAELLS